jgi:hypothetical protein
MDFGKWSAQMDVSSALQVPSAGISKPATKPLYTVESVQAAIKDAVLIVTDGSKDIKGRGQATKNYFQSEIGKYQELIQSLNSRMAANPGQLSADGGIGTMLKVYQDQLDRATKAYSTAPDAPGFDILS